MLLQELIPDALRLYRVAGLAEPLVALIKVGRAQQRQDMLRAMEGHVLDLAHSVEGYRRLPALAAPRLA